MLPSCPNSKPFVKLLGDDHGFCGRIIQLARGFLLHCTGNKGRKGLSRFFSALDINNRKLFSLDTVNNRADRGRVG